MITPLKYIHYNYNSKFIINRDAQNDVASPFLFLQSMIKLSRFNLNLNLNNRRRNSIFQIIKPVNLTSSMADAVEVFVTPPSSPPQEVAEEVKKEEEEEEKKKLQPPTPPEKPEAGDCCGNGCVRCVWDMYYDELEDYNKLLDEFNSAKNS